MLRAEELQFRRGPDILFENLSFVVHPGQRVAIAGRNGVGKSTLFQLIQGNLQPDGGELTYPDGWNVGHMEQEAEVTDQPALEYVVDGHAALRKTEHELAKCSEPNRQAQLLAEYQDLGGYEAHAKAGEILHGLGFAKDDFDKGYATFSGGWRIRLNLAQALMNPCDLLLLDEPTNHLDLEAIMWLESWLARFDGTVLVIAHDRAFLDACTDHTLYLSGQSGRLYSGNYSSCERQRAEYMEQQQAMGAKQAAQRAHIQQFVDRFRAKASKAKQVQSRVKALERMQESAIIQLDSPYTVNFKDPRRVPNPLYSLRHVSLGYDGAEVLHDVSLSILPGARIGVLGANGAGKSTLLKSLVGELKPISGELMRGNNCEVGYFAQHQLETLDPNAKALPMMLKAAPQWREQQCRDYLGRWGFDAGMITRPVATLSGGEKARLVLALIALEEPAILILDEPTNHLDLDMRDALAFALQDYAGAVVIVSHDRILLDKTVDDFWVLENHTLRVYRGDLEEYTTARKAAVNGTTTTADNSNSRKAMRQDRANQRASLKQLRDQVKRFEKDMEKQSKQLQEMEQLLADGDTYASMPKAELDELLAKAGKLRTKLEQTEEDWLEATAALEAVVE
jgi:ATP-binding cassette, subfamily F, member 3